MPILPIRKLPDPALRRKAKRVRDIDGSINRLIDNLLETMHAEPGRVGLAAPQVGVPLRVIVIDQPEAEDIVIINPKIVRRTGERILDEGCLSFPGYFGRVTRAEKVTVKGRDRTWKEVRIRADGLLAQVLEHEIDHLNGTLYVDHLESMDELQKIEPEEPQE